MIINFIVIMYCRFQVCSEPMECAEAVCEGIPETPDSPSTDMSDIEELPGKDPPETNTV